MVVLLREPDLAHVELSNLRDLVVPVMCQTVTARTWQHTTMHSRMHDGRGLALGAGEDDIDEGLRRDK